ncbi:hypothetical protein BaRGS_00024709 [Batillaria attramentaria]|uniref:Profilin n=1 Tax=Batillaria attramentaria TaxID=370345 RepID=A0ABD0KAN8_9CAEN
MASLVETVQPPASSHLPPSPQVGWSIPAGGGGGQFLCPDPKAHLNGGWKAEPENDQENNNQESADTEQRPTEMSNTQEGNAETTIIQDVPAERGAPDIAASQGEELQTPEKKVTFKAGVDDVNEGNVTLREEYVDRVWDDFVTHFLLGSNHIQRAAIFDLVSQRPLASRGGVDISPEEMEQLVAGLNHIDLAYRTGVTIGGRSYKVRLADGRHGVMARTEREGCTVCKTRTLIIIGVHDENGNSRRCNEEVMRLGDFFRRKAM